MVDNSLKPIIIVTVETNLQYRSKVKLPVAPLFSRDETPVSRDETLVSRDERRLVSQDEKAENLWNIHKWFSLGETD